MGKTTKKKKMTFKRVKRIFKNVCTEIANYFVSLWKKFMNLPKYVRNIAMVWVVVLLIIIIIIIASTSNNKHLDEYYKLENIISESTLDYVKDKKIYPVKDSKLKLDMDVLEEYGNLNSKKLKEKSCKGFSLSYYDEEKDDYVIKSYISCDKYMTKDYKDYKDK